MDTPLARHIRLTAALIALLVVGACTSSTTDVTAPTTSKCDVTATSSMTTAPASGGAATVTVDTTRDCTWSASSQASWLSLGSTTTGQGSGSLDVHIGANPKPVARSGVVMVNTDQVAITQAAAPCTFSVTPANTAIHASGGSSTVQVATLDGCSWTTASGAPWLTVSSGANGPGQATVTAAANTGAARSGTVTIAGQAVTVSQAGAAAAPPCSYTLSPASYAASAAGGSFSVALTTGSACAWTTGSNAPWITVVSGKSGSGSGSIGLLVAANEGSARTGTVSIGGQTLSVSQEAADAPPPPAPAPPPASPPPPPPPPPCSFTIAPDSASIDASGGSASVAVTTAGGCAWTAAANAPWITFAGGSGGSGAGSVRLSIAPNTGAARTATATIAGSTFTVNQAAACEYTISPTHASFTSSAGSGTVTVTAGTGCAWTARSQDPWIDVTAGATGSGNGTVKFSVSANGKKDRTGQLTIAGQTFAVSQSGKN